MSLPWRDIATIAPKPPLGLRSITLTPPLPTLSILPSPVRSLFKETLGSIAYTGTSGALKDLKLLTHPVAGCKAITIHATDASGAYFTQLPIKPL